MWYVCRIRGAQEGKAVPDQELRMENKGSETEPKGAFMSYYSGFGTLSFRQRRVAEGFSQGVTCQVCALEFSGDINLSCHYMHFI